MNKKLLLIVTIAGISVVLAFTGVLLYKKFSVTPAVDEGEILSPIITAEWMDPAVLSVDIGLSEASLDTGEEPAEESTGEASTEEVLTTEEISTESVENTEVPEMMEEMQSVTSTEPATDEETTAGEETASSEREELIAENPSSGSGDTGSSESRSGSSSGIDVMQDVSSNSELICEAESGTDLTLADNINKQLKALPSKSYRLLTNNGWRVVLTKQPISTRFQMPSGMHAMVYPSQKAIYYDNTDASLGLVNQGVATAIMVLNNNPQNGAEFKGLYDKEGSNMDPSYGSGTQAFFNFVYDKLITNPDMINSSCPETAKYVKRYL